MKKRLFFLFTIMAVTAGLLLSNYLFRKGKEGAPPYGEAEDEVPAGVDFFAWLKDWERPDGSVKVALQVGHWQNSELPDELERLRGSSGASAVGFNEWEVNLKIVQLVADQLESIGIEVEILPATVPPLYWADVFLAVHADGNRSSAVRGFKIASPWRDFTGGADSLVGLIEASYGKETGLSIDPNVSANMRGYYAFSWWRYEHAVHPMTTAAIIETGFLTSPADRRIIVQNAEVSARGIALGISDYLKAKGLF
ncbi:N-acetylmuramoyl-L-alanine amidase [Patescibacteria group bacterium]|nr:N-acetylmuramoyl-L-alanine amidase [Patescibacteria group bacterium]